MQTAKSVNDKKFKVSNQIIEEHTEMLELLEKLLIIAHDNRYRNLSKFNLMLELLDAWDDGEYDR